MFNFLALLDIRVFGRLYVFVASDWPRTFFTARLFLFSIILAMPYLCIRTKVLIYVNTFHNT